MRRRILPEEDSIFAIGNAMLNRMIFDENYKGLSNQESCKKFVEEHLAWDNIERILTQCNKGEDNAKT